jgi:hypothetical protein
MARKLNIGDKVRISKSALNWLFEHSEETFICGAKFDARGYNLEMRALLEHLMGEPATVIKENYPNTQEHNYSVKLGKWSTNIDTKDLRRVK